MREVLKSARNRAWQFCDEQQRALDEGFLFRTSAWKEASARPCLHLLGLVSDGRVHSHVQHLMAMVERAAQQGVQRLRVHTLTDGRDVPERSALTWIAPLEQQLAALSSDGRDYRIASGGGRMTITMDRYEADWQMVKRGWDCHVHGQAAQRFASASQAIQVLYETDPQVTDQHLPAFVVVAPDERGALQPVGRMHDGDAVLLFNFRGDRALEISRAFEDRDLPEGFDRSGPDGRPAPELFYAGMMEYDGDLKLPRRFLVEPPSIQRTVSDYLHANGMRSFATSETQKFGHVTYFFNGNRSGHDEEVERWEEIESDPGNFDKAPAMKAPEVAALACRAIRSGRFQHLRLNFANGDMVGHTGDLAATIRAVETVDTCVGQLLAAVEAVGGVMLVTADHGNADQMFEVDKKTGDYARGPDGQRRVRTAHSLNPVPLILADPSGRFQLNPELEQAGLANIGASLLLLAGLRPPQDYLPGVVVAR